VTYEVSLTIAVKIENPNFGAPFDGFLEDPGCDLLSLELDLRWQGDVYGQ